MWIAFPCCRTSQGSQQVCWPHDRVLWCVWINSHSGTRFSVSSLQQSHNPCSAWRPQVTPWFWENMVLLCVHIVKNSFWIKPLFFGIVFRLCFPVPGPPPPPSASSTWIGATAASRLEISWELCVVFNHQRITEIPKFGTAVFSIEMRRRKVYCSSLDFKINLLPF